MAVILVADDDPKLLKMVRRTLMYEGFAVVTADTGRETLAKLETQSPDLIVLDWMMPDLDGLEVLKWLQTERPDIPVLMLTARDTVEDRVMGLNQGADDYLVKPFAPSELLARVRALLRRAKFVLTKSALTYADLSLDPVARETRRGERQFELTPKEFDLLHLFMRYPRQVLVRDRILEEIWSYNFGGEDNVLEVYIGYLRKKTEAGGEPRLIHTVRGVGYVLREG